MELPGGAYASIGNYGYGYNGMEKDDELRESLYATLFREGDVSLGTWWKRDPMEMKLVGFSPYIMMGNNPITMIDPNGDIPDFSPMKEAEDNQKLEEDDKPSNQILEQTRTITGLNLSYNNEGKMVYDKKDPYLKDDDKNILGSITAREALKAEIDNPKVTEVHLSKSMSNSIGEGMIYINPGDFYMKGAGADFYGISRDTEGPGMIFLHEYGHKWFGDHTYIFFSSTENKILFYPITDDPVINFTNQIRKEMTKATRENWGERITPLGYDYYGGKMSLQIPYDMNSYFWLMRDIKYNSKKPTPHIQIKYFEKMESKGVK